MSKEAMKMALEALETERENYQDWDKQDGAPEYIYEAITALREALAEQPAQQDSMCSNALRIQGKAYPRTCKKCGLGPCVELAQQALDKKADNARELGLDYEPAQPKYRRGDRLICLETEEYCVIHISGTDRQWVKFPDTHIGVYKNEQLAELFELLPKEIEIEQPAQQEPVAWKLVPREPTHEMLKAMDECSTEGYDERLYAGHAASVYMAAVDAAPTPPAQRTWVGLTDDDKCVKELYESDTDPEWIDGYTAGLKDAENKLRRHNAQPALVVE